MLRKALRVAGKEFTGFFASPAAVLFLAAFLGVTLFIFFWVADFLRAQSRRCASAVSVDAGAADLPLVAP